MDALSSPLTRQQIAEFIKSERGIRSFEALQTDNGSVFDALTNAQFLTLSTSPSLGSERALTVASGEITGTDAGANSTYTLGLANTTVVPGAYGSASKLVTITIDAKGRATSVTEFAINTDNIVEGAANLFFTQARARASVSGTTPIAYNNLTGVFSFNPAGSYGSPTGTLTRTTFASYSAGTTLTFGAAYNQAEHTALATRLAAVESALQAATQILAALVTDLKAGGVLA